ncbi:MAG: hypothetical protein WAV25_03275 [Minisyncoccia bacterium]
MKNFFQNNKNIFITIIILVIVFFVFKYFRGTTISPTESLDNSVVSAGRDVVDLSNSIKTATLDSSLFSIPTYKALQDFSTEITSQPIGRVNPFSPIGSESSQTVTPTQTTSTKK